MKKLLFAPLVFALACASGNDAVRDEAPPPQDAPVTTAPEPTAEKPPQKDYPATRADNVVETLHGTPVRDPYRWLEDEKSPEVQAWMNAQDAYARKLLDGVAARDALEARFKELFYYDAVGVPVVRMVPKKGKRLFYERRHKDKEKAILYVRDGDDGEERVLLDPHAWSKDLTISLGDWTPSWDGKKLVFQQKPNAADEATLHVMDVESGEWSKVDVIPGAKYANPSWTPDSKGFYYEWLPTDPNIKVDERPGYTEIRFHKLGTDPKNDVLVHPRTGDPKTFLAQALSRDGKYLQIYVMRGWSENDVYIKKVRPNAAPDPKDAGKGFTLLAKGDGAKYSAQVWKDTLYITTDEGAPNQRLFKTPVTKLDRAAWKEIIPEDKGAAMVDGAIIGGHLVTAYMRNAYFELRVYTLDGKFVRNVELPGIGTVARDAKEYYAAPSGLEDGDDAYFAWSSFTSPKQVYKSSIKEGKTTVWATVELPIDPSPYTVEQVWYPSKDGTKVPMFLVHRKDLKKDGNNPTILYGYGGFNVAMKPSFRSSLYPWLEAGGIYALANLRGGGEFGKSWHEAGRLDKKQNVFDDFIAASEYLINERYTQPSRLAIWGGSNGGLLVGAAMVQRPELYGAVLCAVPLLDMVRYQQFGSGRTWIPEYGTAEDPAQFKYLHAYSPYHHVKEGTKYPALLMLAADHDDRVDPMHARKFTAAIQNATASDAPAIIRIERNAGHGGADQVRQAIEQYADQFGFLFARFGMKPATQAQAAGTK